MQIASVGIDLRKTTFHLVALGERSKVLVRKKFSRPQLLAYTANLPSSLIGLEACAGSHCLGSVLRAQGHQVQLVYIIEQMIAGTAESVTRDTVAISSCG